MSHSTKLSKLKGLWELQICSQLVRSAVGLGMTEVRLASEVRAVLLGSIRFNLSSALTLMVSARMLLQYAS